MRTVFFVAVVGLVAGLFGMPAASQDRGGETDLFGRNMKDWSRTGTGTNPWRLTTGDTLICDRGASEMYIPERLFADGTLTFEYRFMPAAPKAGYRAAVYVRRPQEGTGVRIDLGDECGKLTATTFTGSSDREKKIEERPTAKVARPIGDWNTVEVVCEGRSVTVKVNGKAASALSQCDLEIGLIALAAEGSEMEFRRMAWKEGK